jgi:hypothetical protein
MLVILAIAGLTMLWFFCGTSNAVPKEAAAQAKGMLPRSIKGMGANLESAKKDAINEASKQIQSAMQLHDPPLESLKVTPDYVRSLLDQQSGHEGDEFKEGDQVFKSWILNFRTDKDLWSDVVRSDHEAQRKLRAEERQKTGSLVIIGLALVLLVGYGYVQLDEYTHRRYTTWLRVGGVGAATAALTSWWFIFF